MHQVLGQMLGTTEIVIAESVTPNGVMSFLTTWYGQFALPILQYLKPPPVQPFLDKTCSLASWHKIGEHRQSLTDSSNQCKNNCCIDYDYKVRDKVLVETDGILCQVDSKYGKEPWTITIDHTNRTIRIQCGTKTERLNIRRVIPFKYMK
jgi:hypothetical protein